MLGTGTGVHRRRSLARTQTAEKGVLISRGRAPQCASLRDQFAATAGRAFMRLFWWIKSLQAGDGMTPLQFERLRQAQQLRIRPAASSRSRSKSTTRVRAICSGIFG